MRVPENARGAVTASSFWATKDGSRDELQWRRGWWDAYDGREPPARPDEAYALGRLEYLEHFAPQRAGKKKSMNIVEVPISSLRDHPQHDHTKTPDTVARMKASIEKHGLKQPLVVQASTRTIISGHRRKWGAEAAGLDTLPCSLLDVDDATALVLLNVLNADIEAPDPFLESAAIVELLEPTDPTRPRWTVPQVAEAFGWPQSWVSRRAALRHLVPALRALRAPGQALERWPIDWLGRLAGLPRDKQNEFVSTPFELEDCREERDLRRLLTDRLNVLSAAPWDIADATLSPRAGACTTCPKTSDSQPGLFDEPPENPDIRKASCLDNKCWVKKLNANVASRIAAARIEHPELVVIDAMPFDADKLPALASMNTVRNEQPRVVKGNAKGAEPAAIVRGDGSVEIAFVVKGGTEGRAAGAEPKEPKKAPTEIERVAASKEDVWARRRAYIADAVRDAVLDADRSPPSPGIVRGLTFVFQLGPPGRTEREATIPEPVRGDVERAQALFESNAFGPSDRTTLLWPRLREFVADGISPNPHDVADETAEFRMALWVGDLLGVDLDILHDEAKREIPGRKFWPEGTDDWNRKPEPARAKAAAAGDDAVSTEATPAGAGRRRRKKVEA